MAVFNTTFFWWFLAFYLVHEIVQLGLEWLNYSHTKDQNEVPAFYKPKVSQEEYVKAKEYSLEKARFGMFSHIVQLPFFWILVLAGGFNFIDEQSLRFTTSGSLSHSVLFCVFLSAYFMVLGLPFKLYSTFVIEEKYGFNKMSFKLFLIDGVKSLVVGALLGLPVLYTVFWFMKTSGTYWWLWVWFALTGFQFLMAALYPTFLAPIFNKFTSLAEGELKDRIEALALKIKFKMSGIFLIDGSKRSGHSNAYFAGMGKFRRIVLYDTLVDQLNTDELISVLAHEMGHNVKKHIRNSMVLSGAMTLVGFYVLSLLIEWPEFYMSFNFKQASVHAALVLFVLVSDVFTFGLTPVMNLFSRKNEYEADRFSVEVTADKISMVGALHKLTKENLSNMNPHAWYSFYHYSHPTTVERAKAIDAIVL